MKEIGGYLPWEFSTTFDLPYPNAYPLNLGRSGLELLVQKRQYKRIWTSVYVCPVVFETLKKSGVEVRFYPLDDVLDPLFSSELEPDEALLYVDYFGVKDKTVERLNRRYQRFIADLTQAFFYRNDSDFDGFNSARKFIGVPDGGFLFADFAKNLDLPRQTTDENCAHLLMRAENLTEKGYSFFRKNSEQMESWTPRKISLLSEKIIRSISLERVAEKRRENFLFLHEKLGALNELVMDFDRKSFVPLVYPLLIQDGNAWKKRLIEQKIFVPTYWPGLDTYLNGCDWERRLTQDLVCLPIDQNVSIDLLKNVREQFAA